MNMSEKANEKLRKKLTFQEHKDAHTWRSTHIRKQSDLKRCERVSCKADVEKERKVENICNWKKLQQKII